MDEQDKRFVNHWVETIKNDLANLTLVVDNFDKSVNFNEWMAECKRKREQEEVKECCYPDTTTAAGSLEYYWVNVPTQNGEYRLFRRSYALPGKLQNTLVEIIQYVPGQNKGWYCVKGTLPHKYDNCFRAIAMVNTILFAPKRELEYRNFRFDHHQKIVLEQQNIKAEFEVLTSKLKSTD